MFYYKPARSASPNINGVIIMTVNILVFAAKMGIGITRCGEFLWAIQGGFAIANLGNGVLLLLDETKPVVTTVLILSTSSISQLQLERQCSRTSHFESFRAESQCLRDCCRCTGICYSIDSDAE
ncbi:hypothetical protein GGR52DRAFT_180496 [Hypoxylon sp. FL1284]|nr:hypothetical protein GGR52DRAFT_180496 [Hypoxylon sp. FL1284]